jgi:hypothetical protein
MEVGMSTNDETGGSSTDPSKTGRKKDGTFAPGKVHNPNGRPAGSRNKATIALEKLMEEGAEKIVQTVIKLANEGDMSAARMVLDRIIPQRKDRPVVVDLPKINSAADIPAATQAILEATASGELTPSEGAALVNIAESHRKAVELSELEERIRAIEAEQAAARGAR